MMPRLAMILAVIASVVALLGGFNMLLNEWRLWRASKRTGRKMTVCLLLAPTLALAFYGSPVDAATITAASCSYADVNTAVNTTASINDTVLIPNGSCSWATGLVVTDKPLTIRGQNECTLDGNGVPTSCPTTITNTSGNNLFLVTTTSTGGYLHRLAHLTVATTGACGSGDERGQFHIRGTSGLVRVDHVKFGTDSCLKLRFHEYVRGVVDHNIIPNNNDFGAISHHGKWAGVYTSTDWSNGLGEGSFSNASNFGGEVLVFEDNTFSRGGGTYIWITDDHTGARNVYRKNRFENVVMANHGFETGGNDYGVRQWEVYNNTFTWTDPHTPTLTHSRGGTAIIFGNTGTGAFDQVYDMSHYREKLDNRGFDPACGCGIYSVSSITRVGTTATATIPGHKCDNSTSYLIIAGAGQAEYNGIQVASGSSALGGPPADNLVTFPVTGTPATPATGTITAKSAFDRNDNNDGSLCYAQPGTGQTDLISGDAYPDLTASPLTWTNKPNPPAITLEPIYVIKNNLDNGVYSPATSFGSATVIENTHFYNVDLGTSLPGTCTVGAGYWKTDEGSWDSLNPGADGRLYKCTSTNTWTLFYTPMNYPHALVATVVAPVSSFPAVGGQWFVWMEVLLPVMGISWHFRRALMGGVLLCASVGQLAWQHAPNSQHVIQKSRDTAAKVLLAVLRKDRT